MESTVNASELIKRFYTAFSDHNSEEMAALYHDEVEFHDPAFGTLKGEKAREMWRMLIGRARGNLNIEFRDVQGSESGGSARWTATYVYGPKKRKVVNEIDATFDIRDGKIIRHVDDFNLWKWSKMALGLPGALLGWTPFMKSKIRKEANKSLSKYINKKEQS